MPPQRRIDVVFDSVKRLQRIGATANLINLLQKQHPADLADVFASLPDRNRRSVFDTLLENNSRLAMESLAELEPEVAAAMLVDHPPDRLARLFQDLPSDDAAALLDKPARRSVDLRDRADAAEGVGRGPSTCSSTTTRPPAAS